MKNPARRFYHYYPKKIFISKAVILFLIAFLSASWLDRETVNTLEKNNTAATAKSPDSKNRQSFAESDKIEFSDRIAFSMLVISLFITYETFSLFLAFILEKLYSEKEKSHDKGHDSPPRQNNQ